MKLIADYSHLISYATAARNTAPDEVDTCRVRVYEPEAEEDWHIVVITETNGWITSAMPDIAGTVLTDFTGVIDPHQVMFVEHLPSEARGGEEETFDLVTYCNVDIESGRFARNPPRVSVGNPSYLRHDRSTVEALVGSEL